MDKIKFKEIDVFVKIASVDFEEFMKKVEEKQNIKYDVIKDESIHLTVLNTDLNVTRLTRYHYKNSKNETIYVIQQSDAQCDDITFTFYLSNKKIEDSDVANLIDSFDDIIHNASK